MGLLAMGRSAFGFSSGFAVKVGNEEPGPQRIKACSPGATAVTAWGMAMRGVGGAASYVRFPSASSMKIVDTLAERTV